jgi:hypothetical protein
MTNKLEVKRIMHNDMAYRRNSHWWAAMRWLDRVQDVPRKTIARLYDDGMRTIYASKHRSHPARMYRKLLKLPPYQD